MVQALRRARFDLCSPRFMVTAPAGFATWSPAAPVDIRREALGELESAYLLLLANHGQLVGLVLGHARGDQVDDTRGSGQRQARFVEAQGLARNALVRLGLACRGDLCQHSTPSVALDAFGGVFDFLLVPESTTVHENRRMGERVGALYTVVRSSDPGLGGTRDLPAFSVDEGAASGCVFARACGWLALATGVPNPRLWWLGAAMTIAVLGATVALVVR